MTEYCQNCGAGHSDQFARVFGDNNNQLQACIDCAAISTVGLGAAAGLDTRERLQTRGGAD